MQTTTETLVGLDLDRLGDWLRAEVPGTTGECTAALIAGGRSNLTYRLTDGQHRWVLRRPPVGELLATAHDMVREHRVMAALQGTAVPVPQIVGLCTDDSVLGAPFYLMVEVPGRPYRSRADLAPLGETRTRAVSESLVDTLAALHAVGPEEVGLADFGRPEGFLARQVGRWRKQFAAAHTRDLPLLDTLHRQLEAHLPASSGTGIVHGDYRLDNVLVDDRDELRAVIDWELATLGDPLTDLALMLVYGRLAAEGTSTLVPDASTAPGYLSEDEILHRYALASGRDLGDIGFHLALASFKLAGIVEGIHYRYVNGQTVGDGFARAGEAVNGLLAQGIEAIGGTR